MPGTPAHARPLPRTHAPAHFTFRQKRWRPKRMHTARTGRAPAVVVGVVEVPVLNGAQKGDQAAAVQVGELDEPRGVQQPVGQHRERVALRATQARAHAQGAALGALSVHGSLPGGGGGARVGEVAARQDAHLGGLLQLVGVELPRGLTRRQNLVQLRFECCLSKAAQTHHARALVCSPRCPSTPQLCQCPAKETRGVRTFVKIGYEGLSSATRDASCPAP